MIAEDGTRGKLVDVRYDPSILAGARAAALVRSKAGDQWVDFDTLVVTKESIRAVSMWVFENYDMHMASLD